MKAYKGFNSKLTSQCGDGKAKNCVFKPGETKKVDKSKTARNGFHCCENPFECLRWYPLGNGNRHFIVEAAGDIDEDNDERIACTQITLVKEMSVLELALEGMTYIINHPDRKDWVQTHSHCCVMRDEAKADAEEAIAIARGENPKVKGPEGSILGLVKETDGEITACKLLKVAPEQQGKWLTIGDSREVEEVE